MKEINVAAGIIYKEHEDGSRKILLIQRAKDDHWPLFYEFPRGKCDKPIGESVVKCVKREIKEETGIDIKVEQLLGHYEYFADKGERHSVCYVFQCRMTNDEQDIKLSKEHQNFMWVSEAGQAQNILLPDQINFAKMVLNPERRISGVYKGNNKMAEQLSRIQRC
jgi:8-oxo-dGTP diphosphatase